MKGGGHLDLGARSGGRGRGEAWRAAERGKVALAPLLQAHWRATVAALLLEVGSGTGAGADHQQVGLVPSCAGASSSALLVS